MKLWLGVCLAVAAVAATGALGGSRGGAASTAAAKPTVAVVVVGSGRVTSKPAGISCPGKCSATFAAGSRVLLTQKANTGVSVSPVGWQLHGCTCMQGASVGLVSCRCAVHRIDDTAVTAPEFRGRARRLLGLQRHRSYFVLCPDWRWERVELLDARRREPSHHLRGRRFVRHSLQDPEGDHQAGPLRSPPGPLRAAWLAGPKRPSPTSSPGASRGSPRPGRRLRPGFTAKTSCSPTRRTASARRTTNPGQLLDLYRLRRRP